MCHERVSKNHNFEKSAWKSLLMVENHWDKQRKKLNQPILIIKCFYHHATTAFSSIVSIAKSIHRYLKLWKLIYAKLDKIA